MPRGAKVKIESIPGWVLDPYLAGEIGYREVARRLGMPRNTVLRTLARMGHTVARGEVDRQGRASRERWQPVPIPDYAAAYQVSDLGRVRRVLGGYGARAGKVLSPELVNGGHPAVCLSFKSRKKVVMIAPLVAGAFLPPRPSPKYVVGHKDGCRANCQVANLFWTTQVEIWKEGRSQRLGRVSHCKLSPAKADEIRAMKAKKTARELAAEYGVSRATIYNIWNDLAWRTSVYLA
jgi:hypothetical protein